MDHGLPVHAFLTRRTAFQVAVRAAEVAPETDIDLENTKFIIVHIQRTVILDTTFEGIHRALSFLSVQVCKILYQLPVHFGKPRGGSLYDHGGRPVKHSLQIDPEKNMKRRIIIWPAALFVIQMTFGFEGVDMTRHDKGIDYVELPTIDMHEAKRFYGEVFGWTFVDYGPDYASFSDGRLDGGFRKESTVQKGGPLIIMYSNDLELILESVKSAGGTIVQEIFDFPGGRRFHFADPSGNELAVWSDK
jgi:predicted enzyme related to lactoylglutathione lyase